MLSPQAPGKGLNYAADCRRFALEAHKDQKYGPLPFSYHLEKVVETLHRFGHNDDEVLAAAWLHDAVEDQPQVASIRQITRDWGIRIGMLVDGVTDRTTDGNGNTLTNRRSRQTYTYANLREIALVHPDVVNIKLADRIANIEASIAGIRGALPGYKDDHLTMYLTEHPFFCRQIGQAGGDPKMWDHLDKLVRAGYKVYHTLVKP